jgi:uncharacterized membrane protein YheB (UPF0754 family)
MTFVRRSGIYFGLVIGLITGFVSDYVALNMLFRAPRTQTNPWHEGPGCLPHPAGRDHTQLRPHHGGRPLFSPDVLFEALLTGPGSDRLFAMVQKEVMAAIDAQTGIATPLVKLTVGTRRYRELKERIAAKTVAMIPETAPLAAEYAGRTLDIENVLIDKMGQLTPEQFDGIMSPIFKDDEMLMITVGAVLGFLIGELQVEMVTHLTH